MGLPGRIGGAYRWQEGWPVGGPWRGSAKPQIRVTRLPGDRRRLAPASLPDSMKERPFAKRMVLLDALDGVATGARQE